MESRLLERLYTLATLVMLTLVVALLLPAQAHAAYRGFSDVSPNAWYVTQGAVDYALDEGIMSGYTDSSGKSTGKFGPGDKITRGQVATILFRSECANDPALIQEYGSTTDASSYAQTSPFRDMRGGRYCTAAINWAREAGIMTGDASTNCQTVRPDDPISRQELATVLCRYAAHKGANASSTQSLDQYPDVSKVSSWAKGSVSWCVEYGIIGSSDKLNPTGSATRAEAAKMIMVLNRDVISAGVEEAPEEPILGGGGGGAAPSAPDRPSVSDEPKQEITFADDIKIMEGSASATSSGTVTATVNNASNIKVGDILIIGDGSLENSQAIKVTSKSGNALAGTIPELHEVFEELYLEGTYHLDDMTFEPAPGVEVEYNDVGLLAEGEVGFGSLNFKIGDGTDLRTFDGDTISIKGSLDFTMSPTLRYKIDFSGGKLNEIYVELEDDYDIECDIYFGGAAKIPIGRFGCPIAGLTPYIVASAAGGVSIGWDFSIVAAAQVNENGIDYFGEGKTGHSEISLEASGRFGFGLGAEIDAAGIVVVEFGADSGASGAVETTSRDSGLICSDVELYWYAAAGIEAKSNLFDVSYTKHSWEFWNADNSPLSIKKHYEDGKEVLDCTYGNSKDDGGDDETTSGDGNAQSPATEEDAPIVACEGDIVTITGVLYDDISGGYNIDTSKYRAPAIKLDSATKIVLSAPRLYWENREFSDIYVGLLDNEFYPVDHSIPIDSYLGKCVKVTGRIGASDTLGTAFGPLFLTVISMAEIGAESVFKIEESQEIVVTGTWRYVTWEHPTMGQMETPIIDFGEERTYEYYGANFRGTLIADSIMPLGLSGKPEEGALVTLKGKVALANTIHHRAPLILTNSVVL